MKLVHLLLPSLICAASAVQAAPMTLRCNTGSGKTYTYVLDGTSVPQDFMGNATHSWRVSGHTVLIKTQYDHPIVINSDSGQVIENGVLVAKEQLTCRDEELLAASGGNQSSMPMDPHFLKAAFDQMDEAGRRAVQENLASFGYYRGKVDGRWGTGTEAAVVSSLDGKYFPTPDVSTPDAAAAFMQSLIMTTNEGEDCDECGGDIATTSEASSGALVAKEGSGGDLETFRAGNIVCQALPAGNFAGAQAQSWDALGGDRSLMQYLQDSADAFYGHDESIFDAYKKAGLTHGDFPPLAFALGYGYWQRDDLSSAIFWLTNASKHGDPNSSYLLGSLALNMLPDGDTLHLDSTIPPGPIDLAKAKTCLEVTVLTDETLVVAGNQYQSYFKMQAALFLAPIYLQNDQMMAQVSGHSETNIDWGVTAPEPEKALAMLAILQSAAPEARHPEFEQAVQDEAQRQIAAAAEEVKAAREETRKSQVLDAASLQSLADKCSGFVSLKGICWALSQSEVTSVLASKGYTCGAETDLMGLPSFVCRNDKAQIKLSDDAFEYNCDAFDVCAYDYAEVAQMLVDKGIVGNMSYKYETISDGVNTFPVESYCSRGAKGEQLCVVKDMNMLGEPVVRVTLSVGAARTDTPGFD